MNFDEYHFRFLQRELSKLFKVYETKNTLFWRSDYSSIENQLIRSGKETFALNAR